MARSTISHAIIHRFDKQITKAQENAWAKHGKERAQLRDEMINTIISAAREKMAVEQDPKYIEIHAIWEKYRNNRDVCQAETGLTWDQVLELHSPYHHRLQQADSALSVPEGNYDANMLEMALTVADYSFIAGAVAGYRYGFKLAGQMGLQCDLINRTGDDILPGIHRDSFHLTVAMAMVDDVHAEALLEAMVEDEDQDLDKDE
jgi:hypothetical protein